MNGGESAHETNKLRQSISRKVGQDDVTNHDPEKDQAVT